MEERTIGKHIFDLLLVTIRRHESSIEVLTLGIPLLSNVSFQNQTSKLEKKSEGKRQSGTKVETIIALREDALAKANMINDQGQAKRMREQDAIHKKEGRRREENARGKKEERSVEPGECEEERLRSSRFLSGPRRNLLAVISGMESRICGSKMREI